MLLFTKQPILMRRSTIQSLPSVRVPCQVTTFPGFKHFSVGNGVSGAATRSRSRWIPETTRRRSRRLPRCRRPPPATPQSRRESWNWRCGGADGKAPCVSRSCRGPPAVNLIKMFVRKDRAGIGGFHCDKIPVMASLCYVCYAMLCYAMLCYAMLGYAMLCYAMLC